jgi:hypothetical protein
MSKITFTDGKAFIDLQPIQPTPGGTLHVIGEVNTDNTNEAKLQKREPQGINPSILLLEIIELDFAPAEKPQKVDYTEGLNTTDQYSSIEIFVEDEQVATIDKIEVVQ